MPKINDFDDRIEHLENALTSYDRKMESTINNLIDKKLMRFLNLKKKNLRKII